VRSEYPAAATSKASDLTEEFAVDRNLADLLLRCEMRHPRRSSTALGSARPDHKERCHVLSGEGRLDRQANDEPSLGTSIGVLCVLLFAMFAIVGNFSIPDVQFVQTDFLADM
jgi:hypothetical protein